MFSITTLHSGMPNGHMIQRIQKATGATLLPWGLLRAISMLCGMHVTTCLENMLAEVQNFPSVPSPIITTSSVNVPLTIRMLFVQLRMHFSIMKAMEAMVVSTFYETGTQRYPGECPLGGKWPLAVPCVGGDAGPGSIDIEALKALVDFFSAKGHPILVIFNYGTTFKGAYDDVQAAGEALIPILNVAGEVTRRRLRKHKPGLQSGPVLLLVSGLGFGLGQSCVA